MFETVSMIIVNVANVFSVYLAAKNNRWTWPIGFVAVTLTAILFFMSRHYMSFALNVYFIITCILGYIHWKKDGEENDKGIHWGPRPYVTVAICAVLAVAMYMFLIHAIPLISPGETSANPVLDSIATAISLVASIQLVRQDITSWILYLVGDIIYVYLGIISDHPEITWIYGLLIPLAAYGLWEFIVKKRRIDRAGRA